MSYSLMYDPDTDCIVLIFKNTVTLESIKEAAPRVARMCEETGCLHILNDMSAATVDVSLMDILSSPGVMDESNISRATKRALVLPSGLVKAVFLEFVTRYKGHNLMIFRDTEQAKRWLSSDVYLPDNIPTTI